MTIEITKGSENPVAEFFSSPSRTPNTDDLARGNHVVPTEWAEQLERERDEARSKYDILAVENMLEVHKLCKERDEAWEEVNKQKNRATYNLDLAKRVRDFWEKCEKERDEAQDIIKKAKAKFCEDGEDGKIASEMFSILIGNI